MKKFLTVFITFLMIFSLSACGSNVSNKSIRKMLQKEGISKEQANATSIVTTFDLKSGIKGLESGNKLVLLTANKQHSLAIVDTKRKSITIPEFGFAPLNSVISYVFGSSEYANKKNAEVFKKYIEKYGIDCLKNKKYAEEYLREITGKGGVVSTFAAQNAISTSTKSMFPKIKNSNDVVVFFEDNSAVPKYYTMESETMVYNWSGIFDESVYKVWKSRTDTRTQNTMISIYGSPYVYKKVWAVVDSDFKEVGTYKSLSEVKSKLMK